MRPAALGTAVLVSASTAAFHLQDPRITEASGIGVGLRSPGVIYVQNDSGDTNRFFAVDPGTGATAATVTVAGATNVDWEDLAVARDPAGVPSVWLADTGDNDAVRREVRIYRVREPRVAPGERGRRISTARAATWRLRYPDGPQDAEALAVTPTGTAYVITKSLLGTSSVYRVPTRPSRSRVQRLVRVGSITLRPHGVDNPFGAVGELAITGAAVSPDGSVLVVRTYAEAYAWRLTGGDVPAALRRPPTMVRLPRQPQGEGIALRSATSALVDSEGRGSSVYRIRLPILPAPAPSTHRATTNPAPTDMASSRPSASDRAARRGSHGRGRAWPLVLGGLAVGVGLLGLAVRRRRSPGLRGMSGRR